MKHIIMSILLGWGATASAEIYQWVDDRGQTHYGDKAARTAQPGRQAEKLDIAETAQEIDPDAERNRQQLRTLHRSYNEQRRADAQNADEMQLRHQRLQQSCKTLQDCIRTERRAAILFRYDDAGNRILWTAEERVAYREQLQAMSRQYCTTGQ